ncbi:MAG: hypothetical protein HO274_12570 [Ferrovum myxofaciens]|uniref:SPOR domain-containing protein n=1 Tax=Ferrovum myxofaciens TaxID=416213 RepID=UPI002356086B|nr:SPOR domain-containing protein [Ferrovum myxofaciens]QKE42041.1 MAG: hypothetical protein HO274_12570 [Ferrovum myxofaciens]
MENNPDLQLMRQRHRQRLIGVGVLASLTAVGVPLLLDQARAPKEGNVSPTPSIAPAVPVVPQLYGSTPPAGTASGSVGVRSSVATNPVVTTEELVDLSVEKETTPSAAVPVQKPITQTPVRKPETVKSKTVDALPAIARGEANKSEVAAAGTEIWIQVGVFAHQERVTQLEKKLLKLGFPPHIDSLESAGTPRWRVRIGPFPSESALSSALQRLNQLGVQGMRVSSPQ